MASLGTALLARARSQRTSRHGHRQLLAPPGLIAQQRGDGRDREQHRQRRTRRASRPSACSSATGSAGRRQAPRRAGEPQIAYTQDRATWREQQAGHADAHRQSARSCDAPATVISPSRRRSGPRLTRDGTFGLCRTARSATAPAMRCWTATGSRSHLRTADTPHHHRRRRHGPQRERPARQDRRRQAERSDEAAGRGQHRCSAPIRRRQPGRRHPASCRASIEESNVQPVLEMTRMMDDLREFQFTTQFIQAEADRSSRRSTRLGAAA